MNDVEKLSLTLIVIIAFLCIVMYIMCADVNPDNMRAFYDHKSGASTKCLLRLMGYKM